MSALLLGNKSVVSAIRRELKRMVDVNVDEEGVIKVLRNEVIKREALEGPLAESAAGKVKRMQAKMLREQEKPKGAMPENVDLPTPAPQVTVSFSPALGTHKSTKPALE